MLICAPLTLACTLLGTDFGVPAARTLAFPLTAIEVDAQAGSVSYAPRAADLERLTQLQRVTLSELLLPDGTSVTCELERLDLERLGFGVFVDGQPRPETLLELSLSVWRGTLAGAPSSDVALSFSRQGCYGWIRTHGEVFHLISRPGPERDWTRFEASLVGEAQLTRLGASAPGCSAGDLPTRALAPVLATGATAAAPPAPSSSTGVTYEARVAIESDYQYYQLFGSTTAALAYMTPLFAYVSALFEQQVGTVLTYPYLGLYTTPLDPWTTGDLGGNCIDMIYEFQAAWAGNLPAGADLGYLVSGAPLGCGAGFIGGLCDEPRNFAVAGNQNGLTPFPVAPHALNIDFYAATHEIGHTFGAIHTHDYCPPLDECSPPGYFGPCQTQQACVYPGTLMSYCHTCGGFGNVDTVFHPQSAADMRAWVETAGCLTPLCPPPSTYCVSGVNSQGCSGAIATTGTPSLSGPDDFHVTASDVIANQFGLMFYGFGAASTSIPPGTLCVAPPLVRTPVVNSGGSAPPPLCDGRFDFHWTQAYSSAHGLSAGTQLYAQFWYRDPGSPAASVLTNAVQFSLCP